jgi:hypothetical protein
MDMTLWTILVVVGLTAATVLLTGPGMWSDKWGWNWTWLVGKRDPKRDEPKR